MDYIMFDYIEFLAWPVVAGQLLQDCEGTEDGFDFQEAGYPPTRSELNLYDLVDDCVPPPPDVKFLDYSAARSAYLRIDLDIYRPVHTVTRSEPTEEGHDYVSEEWFLEDDVVRHVYHREARDCDGKYSYYQEYTCPFEDLAANRDINYQVSTPKWTEVGRTQRDHSAEAAGY